MYGRFVWLLIVVLLIVGGYYFVTNSLEPLMDVTPVINTYPPASKLIIPEEKEENIMRIYALGDSLTAGYRLPLEDSYPAQLQDGLHELGFDYDVINGGKSGDTSAALLARVDWIVADAVSGDIALLVIGANDGLQSLSVLELERNIVSIIELLMDRNLRVVLGGMQLPTNLDPLYRENFSALYPRIAQTYDLPLIPFFLENVAAIPSLNLPDGIHPTAEGYAIIAEQVLDFLLDNDLLV